MFVPQVPLIENALRVVLVYALMVVLVRLGGKRGLATMNTLDDRTSKVPVASCSPCHTEGGALEKEVSKKRSSTSFRCVKCHLAFGGDAVPASHLKEVPAAAAPK